MRKFIIRGSLLLLLLLLIQRKCRLLLLLEKIMNWLRLFHVTTYRIILSLEGRNLQQ